MKNGNPEMPSMDTVSTRRCGSRGHRLTLPAGLVAFALLWPAATPGAELTYNAVNAVTNPGWFTADAWLDDEDQPASWSSGDTAILSHTSNIVVTFDQDTATAGLHVLERRFQLRPASTTEVYQLTMNGGEIHVKEEGVNRELLLSNVQIVGSFTKTGAGDLEFRNLAAGTVWPLLGTATVDAGLLNMGRINNTINADSHFVVNASGALLFGLGSTSAMGSLTVNGGSVQMGRSTGGNDALTFDIGLLSGTGGKLFVQGRAADLTADQVKTLRINQDSNTTFNADIEGVHINEDEGYVDSLIQIIHQGTGTLSLGGSIHLERRTDITAGRLNINSANTQFANRLADESAALFVNGGTLGGTGTITVTDNKNVELSATGKLAAGIAGEAGRTTYALVTGTLDLSDATAGANSGWLMFELGSAATAGTTYDQIRLTSGTLDIGGGLSFSDFDFTLLSGFGPGTYVLFDTDAPILGSLGTVTDELGGYESTLSISGNNLVLTVIPEPGSIGLILGGSALALAARRRRG